MNNYTLNDVKKLILTYVLQLKCPKDDMKSFTGTWMDVFKSLKKDFIDNDKKINTEEMIFDLLCPFWYGFSSKYATETGLIDMAFKTPLNEMPLYIDSEEEWRAVVSRWRLMIGK